MALDLLPSEYKGWLEALVPLAGIELDVDLLWRAAEAVSANEPMRSIAMVGSALDLLDGNILNRILTKDPPIDIADADAAGNIIARMRRSLSDRMTAITSFTGAGGPAIAPLSNTSVFTRSRYGRLDPNNPAYYGGPDSRWPY